MCNFYVSMYLVYLKSVFFPHVLCFVGHLFLDLFCNRNQYDWIGCAWRFLLMHHKEQILWMWKEIPGKAEFT